MPITSMSRVLGLLGYLFCACAVCALAWTIWKGKRVICAERCAKLLDNLRRLRETTKGVVSLNFVVAIILCLAASSVLVYAMVHFRLPEEIHHKVRIERRISADQWWLVDQENPQGFMYAACHDFPNEEWIKAGYFAREARWQVKGGCNSIKASGMGFFYLWDGGIAKTIREAGYE